jgi:protein-tyrosine phosphatase
MVTGGERGPRACTVSGRSAAACNAEALERALAAIAAALAASPSAKVYVHCARGEDRTGLLIAALRLRQGCPADEARREMRQHHYWPYPPLEAVWQQLTASPPRPRASVSPPR